MSMLRGILTAMFMTTVVFLCFQLIRAIIIDSQNNSLAIDDSLKEKTHFSTINYLRSSEKMPVSISFNISLHISPPYLSTCL